MTKNIFTALTALILCFVLIFISTAIPASAYDQPNDTVESISIHEQSGVLEGETLQMQASIESSSAFFDSVEWSSSNPQAISCTKDGKIEGLVAGKSATITCKAKYGSAKDSITVYCVKELSQEVKSGFKYPIASIYSSPDSLIFKDLCIDFSSLRGPFSQFFLIFAKLGIKILPNALRVTFNQVTVCGKSGSYAYIRYGENNLLDGFVKNSSLKNTGNAFLTLSTNDMDVWANGIAYDHRKLTTKYKGDIEWIYDEDSDYFEFDETTGQVIGKVPGKNVTITAKADGETATCTIHLLYKWPQAWTGKTNRNTNIYYAVGNSYNKGSTSLPTGTEFVVEGDCGTSNGWAYGYCEINGENCWGYIPISHISTKGTVSQYNNMGWRWPLKNIEYNYIKSPYGKRKTDPTKHKGFDISTNWDEGQSSVSGQTIVSAFKGTVDYVCKNSSLSWGYCVSIISDEEIADPVSGKQFVAIYMHMKNTPKVIRGKEVSKETELGYVGTTGNSTGAHLHFEVNNKTASIYESNGKEDTDPGRSSYNDLINPIFFYMSFNPKYNETSDAEKFYYGTYWYGSE